MPAEPAPAADLAGSGRRLTAQRKLIRDALGTSRRTVAAVELYEQLRVAHPSLGRATVFRSLDMLVDMGLARRFEGEGHVYLYTACDPVHHHHLVCRECGSIIDIAEAEVSSLVRSVQRRHGFEVDHASLDLYGTCRDCAARWS